MSFANTFEEREKRAEENPNRNVVYGYRTDERRKFYVDVEDILACINGNWGFADDYYVFPTKKERDDFAKEEKAN